MDAIYDTALDDMMPGKAAQRILLIMLPGARDTPQDLVRHGFVRAVRERGLPVDVIAADAHMDYYIEQQVIERLAADIITPARARGYSRIWLMGISLGGLGCMAYLRAHPAHIEGVILLAPFLGTRGLIAEVTRAGGLDRWQPGDIKPDDDERALMDWLKNYQADDASLPGIYLGYGTDDRFAPASELLAARLPAGQVATVKGGHNWDAWMALWNKLLDRGLFSTGHRNLRQAVD